MYHVIFIKMNRVFVRDVILQSFVISYFGMIYFSRVLIFIYIYIYADFRHACNFNHENTNKVKTFLQKTMEYYNVTQQHINSWLMTWCHLDETLT